MESVCHAGGEHLQHFLSGWLWKDGWPCFLWPSFRCSLGRPACFAGQCHRGRVSVRSALCHFAALGILDWVAHNGFNPRYATTSVIMLQCALAVFAGMQWYAVLGDRKASIVAAGCS